MTVALGDVVEVVGRFVSASNATFLGVTARGVRVVYKPDAGERPLWDFPAGTLATREVLTYELDLAMGLGVVPETALGSGPFGPGAVQRFVEEVATFDPLPLAERGDEALWPVAVLDLVTNNADRKLGHILETTGGLAAVDHGLTFHAEPKLRTVLWAFAGRPLPAAMVAAVGRLDDALRAGLGDAIALRLGPDEAIATQTRVQRLLDHPFHPSPPADRPAVPWPPY